MEVKVNDARPCQCLVYFSLLNLFQVDRNICFIGNKYLAIIKNLCKVSTYLAVFWHLN